MTEQELEGHLLHWAQEMVSNTEKMVTETTKDPQMVTAANAVFAPGLAGAWIESFGVSWGMKLAFLLGGVWQREIQNFRDDLFNGLMKDVRTDGH